MLLIATACGGDDGDGSGQEAVEQDEEAIGAEEDAGIVGDGQVIFDAGPPLMAECGGESCTEYVNLVILQLDPCCAEEGIDDEGNALSDVCGVGFPGMGCVQVHQPGEPSEQCPDEVLGFGVVMAEGCCRPDGRCGLISDDTLGCIARDDPSGEALMATFDAIACDP